MKPIATAESQYFPNCGFISTTKGHGTSPPAFPIHQIDDTTIKLLLCCQSWDTYTQTSSLAQPSLLLLAGPGALRFISYLMQLVLLSHTAQAQYH